MKKIFLIISFFFISVAPVVANFDAVNIRVDHDLGSAEAIEPQVALGADETVYVAWKDTRGGNDIYFNRSGDGGSTWLASDIVAGTTGGSSQNGKLRIGADQNGHVYIFHINGSGNGSLSVKVSLDYGQTWMGNILDVGGNAWESNSVVSFDFDFDDQGRVCAVWDSSGNDDEIYINCSSDYGVTWYPSYKQVNSDVPYPYDTHRAPSVCLDSSNRVYVAWEDNRGSSGIERFIYFNVSSDLGQTWPGDRGMNSGPGMRTAAPQVACTNDGNVYVGWERESGFNDNTVYLARSNTAGVSFQSTDSLAWRAAYSRLYNDDQGRVYFLYSDISSIYQNVMFRRSDDYALSWTSALKINKTNNNEGGNYSFVFNGPKLAVVWENNEPWQGIYANTSYNYGDFWSSGSGDIRVDDNPGSDIATAKPSAGIDSSGNIVSIWEDGRNGNTDLFSNQGQVSLESEVMLEADYILSCQYTDNQNSAYGAINNVFGFPTWVVPRENALAILGLIEASTLLDNNLYWNQAQLAADYLVSVQDPTDGAWFDQYDFTTPVLLEKSPTQTTEVMLALYKLGFKASRYSAMKMGAQYLLSTQDPANKGGIDDGLLGGGKDASGVHRSYRWASDNSFGYWALKAAQAWAIASDDITFATQCGVAAQRILDGINNVLYVNNPQSPDDGVWWRAVDDQNNPVDASFHEWINYAPQMLDVPAIGVGSTVVGNWINQNLQNIDGSVFTNDVTNADRKSPGFSFQASLSWQDLGQNDFANKAISWARTSGLWQEGPDSKQVVGGWIDWIEPTTQAPEYLRFIDTSFYAISAFSGGYDFSTSVSGQFEAPTVTVTTSVSTIESGVSFEVTVSGSSDAGLASVWWFIEDINNRVFHTIPGSVDGVSVNLAAAQGFGTCKDKTSCEFTRTIIIDKVGEYEIKANSRDNLYPHGGHPHQASEGVGIPVVSINVLPVFQAMASSFTVFSGQTLEFAVKASDVDGDDLQLKIVDEITGAQFTTTSLVDPNSGSSHIEGTFRWRPRHTQLGLYSVQFEVSDGIQTVVSDPVVIDVQKRHRYRHRKRKHRHNRFLFKRNHKRLHK